MDLEKQMRSTILELASEDEFGSWELWWRAKQDVGDMTEDVNIVRKQFIDTIEALTKEQKLVALDHKEADDSYKEVLLDRSRLEFEVNRADKPDPATFYWFAATEKGKKEDLSLRS